MNDVSQPGPLTLTPIDRPSLHDTIVQRLRTMIYDGDLKPGQKVPEKLLCDSLGISRTPLREALKVLASEGLLELAPNRGARVTRLTARDVDEMFPVMGALEALAGELACENLSDADIADIRDMHQHMDKHRTAGDLAAYFEINERIHERILALAGNDLLNSLYGGLAGRIRRARYRLGMSAERWQRAMAEHAEMLAAIEARDGRTLAEVLKRHLRNKCETVKAALAEQAD